MSDIKSHFLTFCHFCPIPGKTARILALLRCVLQDPSFPHLINPVITRGSKGGIKREVESHRRRASLGHINEGFLLAVIKSTKDGINAGITVLSLSEKHTGGERLLAPCPDFPPPSATRNSALIPSDSVQNTTSGRPEVTESPESEESVFSRDLSTFVTFIKKVRLPRRFIGLSGPESSRK